MLAITLRGGGGGSLVCPVTSALRDALGCPLAEAQSIVAQSLPFTFFVDGPTWIVGVNGLRKPSTWTERLDAAGAVYDVERI